MNNNATTESLLSALEILKIRSGLEKTGEDKSREAEISEELAGLFTGADYKSESDQPLHSIFSRLNGRDKKDLLVEVTDEDGPGGKINQDIYRKKLERIEKELDENPNTIQVQLGLLEHYLSDVPAGSLEEFNDISLFDYAKLKALFASMLEKNPKLMEASLDELENEKSLLLFSADFSGIQNFIYTIGTKNALKNLRTRSFYLELLMEHFVDELFEATGTSRVNLLYSGGGHCYLLLPNTEEIQNALKAWTEKFNTWLMEKFGTALYLATGSAACSVNDLLDRPEGSYRKIFREVSSKIAKKKQHRYTEEQILSLNCKQDFSGTEECQVCGKTGKLRTDKDGAKICRDCYDFQKISPLIQANGMIYLTESDETIKRFGSQGFFLPGFEKERFFLIAPNEGDLRLRKDSGYVRSYSKGEENLNMGNDVKIYVSDYAVSNNLNEFDKLSPGIDRLGVLRMDVDNLGNAFVRGFESEDHGLRYVNILRTSILSRKLSSFFKRDLDLILKGDELNVVVVYSGGDDLFLIGTWWDTIRSAVRIYDEFERYTDRALTVSGGIGIFGMTFPVILAAEQTGELEEAAKSFEQNSRKKDAIALFSPSEGKIYHWDQFMANIYQDKISALAEFFDESKTNNRGNSFLYNILELLRLARNERINLARLAYLLARLEPKDPSQQNRYRQFSEKLMGWAQDPTEREELISAIELYVYKNRKKSEHE